MLNTASALNRTFQLLPQSTCEKIPKNLVLVLFLKNLNFTCADAYFQAWDQTQFPYRELNPGLPGTLFDNRRWEPGILTTRQYGSCPVKRNIPWWKHSKCSYNDLHKQEIPCASVSCKTQKFDCKCLAKMAKSKKSIWSLCSTFEELKQGSVAEWSKAMV